MALIMIDDWGKPPTAIQSQSALRKTSLAAENIILKTSPKRSAITTILHIEDDQSVAAVVKALLEAEGWQVDTCLNGVTGLMKIAGESHYDLLLIDNDLPEVAGSEILRQTRIMPHRSRLPIIMLSGSLYEPTAPRLGGDLYLRKPDDV